jgi:predicted DCC family thiol-disulfide oxidoreductase YuxK
MPATLIYDGQCGFCKKSARLLQELAGPERLAIVSLDAPSAMDLHPDLSFSKALEAPQLVLENGYLCQGAEAAFNAAGLRPSLGFLKYLYYFPVIRQFSDFAYKIVSQKRNRCESCDS